ncbi:MAG: zinc-ribbon domain-containing protein [Limosilactobacillus sp.]
MKKFCKYCGAPLKEGQVFCEQCGHRVDDDTAAATNQTAPTQPASTASRREHTSTSQAVQPSAQPTSQETADTEQQRLQEKIENLQRQLRDQQQNGHVNVFQRLAFSRRHWRQVFRFMNNNALTMLFFFVIALYLVAIRWWIFLVFILLTYIYPLLSNEENYPWEVSFNRWLNDKSSLARLKDQLRRAQEKSMQMSKQVFNSQRGSSSTSQTSAPAMGQATAPSASQSAAVVAPASNHFKTTGEFIVGIIFAVIGAILYFGFASSASSTSQQIMSVVENQSLSASGYAVFWGMALGILGVMMFIGGLVNGFKHHHQGRVWKIIGAVLILLFAVVTSYVYANAAEMAVNAAGSVLSGDTSLEDLENLASMVHILPWIGAILYAVGILVNGLAGGHHE